MRFKKNLKSFKEGFEEFGSNITTIINVLLLTLVYLIGVGTTSLIAKLFKKKFIQTKTSKDKSYWKDLNIKKKPKEDHFRQF